MKTMSDNTIIGAIATSPGCGAVAVIRLSGAGCIELAEQVFQSPSGKRLVNVAPNTVHFGRIMEENELVDEVLLTVFRAPHSFTGEDVVEISCHGSVYIQQRVLQLLIDKGAVLAQPGEFTRRAFLNGKMDLSQAEAVADLIASSSAAAHKMALHQMRGGFSRELERLRQELLHVTALLELELDFSEEDVEFAERGELLILVEKIRDYIKRLCDSFALGNAIKNGIPVAIVGNTNAGKSTLLNRLLKEERAIVSDNEGTTRDSIEETLNVNGVLFRFIDTAGIRHTLDQVEQLGIERTWTKIEQAKIVLLLLDVNRDFEQFVTYYQHVKERLQLDATLLILLNKAEIAHDLQETLDQVKKSADGEWIHPLSAKTGDGVEILLDYLSALVGMDKIGSCDVVVNNARHYEALTRALEAMDLVQEGLHAGLSGEFIAQDIRSCLHYLAEITGLISTEDVLQHVFSHFCIGK